MKLFHITQTQNRADILRHGLRGSRGWSSGDGVYVTKNPMGWIFMFEEGGIYETDSVDIWEVDTKGYRMVPDTNETADSREDFVIMHNVPVSRVRLVERVVIGPLS